MDATTSDSSKQTGSANESVRFPKEGDPGYPLYRQAQDALQATFPGRYDNNAELLQRQALGIASEFAQKYPEGRIDTIESHRGGLVVAQRDSSGKIEHSVMAPPAVTNRDPAISAELLQNATANQQQPPGQPKEPSNVAPSAQVADKAAGAKAEKGEEFNILPKDHPLHDLSNQAARAVREGYPSVDQNSPRFQELALRTTLVAATAELTQIDSFQPGPRSRIDDIYLTGVDKNGQKASIHADAEFTRRPNETIRADIDTLVESRKNDPWHDEVKSKLDPSKHQLYDDAVRTTRTLNMEQGAGFDERKSAMALFKLADDNGMSRIADAQLGVQTANGRNVFISENQLSANEQSRTYVSNQQINATDPQKVLEQMTGPDQQRDKASEKGPSLAQVNEQHFEQPAVARGAR
jgi:hypothetical protein